MVLHQQTHEPHERTQHVVGNGWKGVNILDKNYTAKDPHLLKVLLSYSRLFLKTIKTLYVIFVYVILRFC
jgi:hypothetical protein